MLNSSDLKVGIVDDSPLIRKMIQAVIDETPGMVVVGTAEDPFKAREMIKETNPDVITLDVEMPKMNGIEFLEKIMKLRPMPVIMVSTLTQRGADITLQALEIGAVDYVAKPGSGSTSDDILGAFRNVLIPKLKNVQNSNFHKMQRLGFQTQPSKTTGKNINYDLIGIASSTGGVERLRYMISHITSDLPPIMIVQHINELYVPSMVQRMQTIAPEHIRIKIAEHKESLERNTIYFADNYKHLRVKDIGGKFRADVYEAPELNGFIASADYLFQSMAEIGGKKLLGIILSGMGTDGAQGLATLKKTGAPTLGESKSSCLVYGMSRAAADIGAVEKEASINQITNIVNGGKI